MTRPKIVIKSKKGPQEDQSKRAVHRQTNPKTNVDRIQETDNIPETPLEQETRSKTKKNQKKPVIIATLVGLALLLINGGIWFFIFNNQTLPAVADKQENTTNEKSDIENDSSKPNFEKEIASKNTSLNKLLNVANLPSTDINAIISACREKGIERLRKGDRYTLFYKEDQAFKLLIEPKVTPYIKWDINLEEIKIERFDKKREIKVDELGVIVESNLALTFLNNNLNMKLISKIEDIFKYSVDLFKLDDGDRIKILYNTEYVDEKPYKIKGIQAIYILSKEVKHFAFRHKESGKFVYYDENGKSLKRQFLSSPIKYGGVITSGFGFRLHPTLGHRKMHLGTDYAAPEGTPIIAVSDGVVTGRAMAGESGNFIKLKHRNNIETQYLHLQKFHPEVVLGTRVKQGQTIGYVGMTGRATGPHVCYHFKKNGKQVDPMLENTTQSKKIDGKDLSRFLKSSMHLKSKLKEIEYH